MSAVRRAIEPLGCLVRLEVRIWVSLWRWLARRPYVPTGAQPFPHAGAAALMIWMFIALSAVEVVALDLVIPWEPVRLAALVLGVWGLLWMLGYLASLRVRPHLVTDEALVVRGGMHQEFVLAWHQVSAVTHRRRDGAGRTLVLDETGVGGVLGLPVGGQTNIDVLLVESLSVPLRRRGAAEVIEVRLWADDGAALAEAARGHIARARGRDEQRDQNGGSSGTGGPGGTGGGSGGSRG